MKIVLIGYMGSGKSTVGRLLSEALKYTFEDLDVAIESAEGASVSQVFQKKGEIYFRKREAMVLTEVLSEKKSLVLALGGGTPCYGTIMTDLRANEEVVTVYLKSGLGILTQRLFEEKNDRPLIAHIESKTLLNDFIRKHLFERSYYYNQSEISIDCDALSPSEIVEKIILKLF